MNLPYEFWRDSGTSWSMTQIFWSSAWPLLSDGWICHACVVGWPDLLISHTSPLQHVYKGTASPLPRKVNRPTLFPKGRTQEICWTEPTAGLCSSGGAPFSRLCLLYWVYPLTSSRFSMHLCQMKGSSQLYSERKLSKSLLLIYFSSLEEHVFCPMYMNLHPWLRLDQRTCSDL